MCKLYVMTSYCFPLYLFPVHFHSLHSGELKKTDGYYSCSLDTSHPDPDVDPDPDEESDFFFDTSRFKITLYHNRSNGHVSATLLDKEYMPVKHSKCLLRNYNTKHDFVICLPICKLQLTSIATC